MAVVVHHDDCSPPPDVSPSLVSYDVAGSPLRPTDRSTPPHTVIAGCSPQAADDDRGWSEGSSMARRTENRRCGCAARTNADKSPGDHAVVRPSRHTMSS